MAKPKKAKSSKPKPPINFNKGKENYGEKMQKALSKRKGFRITRKTC